MSTHPALRVLRSLVRVYTRVAAWYWGIIVAIVVVLVAAFGVLDEVRISGWSSVTTSAVKYWILSIGVMMPTVHLRFFVANGITRRHFTLGAGLFGIVFVTSFSLIGLLGHAVEHPVYAAAGWLAQLDEPYLVGSVADGALYLARAIPLHLVHFVAGALIGTGFYRFGVWRGIALIPPFAALIVLAEVGFGSEWNPSLTDGPVPFAVASLGALALAALAGLAARTLLATVPLNRTTA
ncbi:hypothetical protein [Spirilliplanes yamanashiensis]|uniref:Uncharacterized protein n=1 Tax=Spirilliplanes yamanashiensis TaxID=42233 RepID=A0A8J4DGI9_9ACTN|nr:hypothetical protein [Spirilliplanes yamanashiensis]MDP9819758.1 hypothetical protein [Spirilliplanes yamanashiensis]GIJ01422.1 hypothetical protein Sya03_07740 [Spirilliplanes yamanashiensis]